MNPIQVFRIIGGVISVAIVVGLFVFTWRSGANHVQEKWDKEKAAFAVAAEEKEDQAKEVVIKTEIQYVDRVKIIREKGDAIIKEIPVYVSDTDRIPGSYGVLYNAAVSGDPLPAGGPGESANTDYSLEDFAATDLENINICREYQARITAWEEYYERLRQIYPEAKK